MPYGVTIVCMVCVCMVCVFLYGGPMALFFWGIYGAVCQRYCAVIMVDLFALESYGVICMVDIWYLFGSVVWIT